MHKLKNLIIAFRDEDDGIATAWALSWLILCFAIAGLSIDITNAWKVKSVLQSTADVAAHAGALELAKHGNLSIETEVEAIANIYATKNMNPGLYGDVLIENDIRVGFWDEATRTFSEMIAGEADTPNAVRVVTRQDGTAGASNRVGTFFLRMVWKKAFTVSALATVERFVSICEKDGIFANGEVFSTAQVTYKNEYCKYGALGISMAQLNEFEPGTIAMTPNLDNCGPGPESCTDAHNPGIEDALMSGSISLGKVGRISEYFTELQDPNSDYQPEYINTALPVNEYYNMNDFDTSLLVPGEIFIVHCSGGNNNLNLGIPTAGGGGAGGGGAVAAAITVSEFVLVGYGCDFVFDASIQYEDAMFITNATGNQTVSGAASVVLGKDDGCAQGGEVVVITAGDVRFAAKLEAYDSEFIIGGDLHLASNGNADSVHEGSNFYVGGDVHVTTHHTFSGCNGYTIPPFDTRYSFRIVE